MEEDEEAGAQAVGEDLDVCSRAFAAGGAGAGKCEGGFLVGVEFGGLGAEQEEGAEEREGGGVRVESVDGCGEDGEGDAEGGQ